MNLPSNYLPEIHEMTGRKNSYDVEVELDVRQWLEMGTDRRFECHRSEVKIETDIKVYRFKTGLDWDKHLCAYIEVEEGSSWAGEHLPDNWYCISLLARKIYKFNWRQNQWTNELVDNADNTIYLKVSRDFHGMFCVKITDAAKYGKGSYGKKGLAQLRNDTYVDLPINHACIVHGKTNCLKFINDFLNRKSHD